MRSGGDFKVRVDELISRDHWLYEQAMEFVDKRAICKREMKSYQKGMKSFSL